MNSPQKIYEMFGKKGLRIPIFLILFLGLVVFIGENEASIDPIHPSAKGNHLPPDDYPSSSMGSWLPIIYSGHDKTAWHPLTVSTRHHHGVNPAEYENIFGEVLTDYLEAYGSISYPWQTPNENLLKHTGYTWLYDEAENGCELFNIDGNPNCVTHVLVQVHSIGTPHAVYTRFHSQYAFVRICTPNGTQCGIVATGGHADYGILHSPYKEEHCELESDPPGFGELGNVLHQPPYRSNPREYFPGRSLTQFWNSLGPNAITLHLFPNEPNQILGLAWLSPDSWAALSPTDCSNADEAIFACADGSCEYNHSKFHVFSVRIRNIPEAPYIGWTNRWGHVVENCTVASLDCVPLTVTAGVPEGSAWLNRQVNQGEPDLYSPAQEFDVFDENGNTMGWIKHP